MSILRGEMERRGCQSITSVHLCPVCEEQFDEFDVPLTRRDVKDRGRSRSHLPRDNPVREIVRWLALPRVGKSAVLCDQAAHAPGVAAPRRFKRR